MTSLSAKFGARFIFLLSRSLHTYIVYCLDHHHHHHHHQRPFVYLKMSESVSKYHCDRRSSIALLFGVAIYAFLGSLSNAEAFSPKTNTNPSPSATTTRSRSISTTSSSSTRLHGMFDFVDEGKKALVKKLAGDYDEVAIQNRLKTLIEENKVLMLSFTT